MDDFEEFMNEASGSPPPIPTKKQRVRDLVERLNASVPDDEDDEKKSGALTQYSMYGTGYVPTTSTTETLPPNCYKIGVTPNGGFYLNPQKLTTDNLMRLPDSKSDEVVAEVNRFWTLKPIFKEYGFSHKRGFLLFGPPGSGKTSTIQIILSDMIKMGGIVIIAEHPGYLSEILAQFRSVEPDRQLVVIWEDIDTVIQRHGESEVLSILDGESQVENVVFIATTNYPENLDGRIINRPSRFDRIVKIGMPNADARKMYLESKIGTVLAQGVNEKGETVEVDLVKETDGLSIAHLKELIVSWKCQESPVLDVLRRLQKMKVKPKSDEDRERLGL